MNHGLRPFETIRGCARRFRHGGGLRPRSQQPLRLPSSHSLVARRWRRARRNLVAIPPHSHELQRWNLMPNALRLLECTTRRLGLYRPERPTHMQARPVSWGQLRRHPSGPTAPWSEGATPAAMIERRCWRRAQLRRSRWTRLVNCWLLSLVTRCSLALHVVRHSCENRMPRRCNQLSHRCKLGGQRQQVR